MNYIINLNCKQFSTLIRQYKNRNEATVMHCENYYWSIPDDYPVEDLNTCYIYVTQNIQTGQKNAATLAASDNLFGNLLISNMIQNYYLQDLPSLGFNYAESFQHDTVQYFF
jgi:hypothetical protein